MTSHYRLGFNGLTPSEIALVQTLLRLATHHRDVRWVCPDTSPWHALLLNDLNDRRLDHDDLEAELPGLARDTPYVLRLTSAGSAPRAGAMARPIRGEKLMAWLDQVEAALAGNVGPITIGEPASQHQGSRSADALLRDAPRRRLLRKLPTSLVRNSADRHRMARLLARHALNAQDLHRLTGVSTVECLVCLKVLDAHQLLSPVTAAQPRPDAPPAGAPQSARVPASWQRATAGRPGLVRRLASGALRRLVP